jgi:hypothetical protein
MMSREHSEDSREHRAVSALLPWYVNETLSEGERERFESHLAGCGRCQEDLLREQRLYRDMRSETSLEYMPTASLKRLQARLDGIEASVPQEPRPETRKPVRRLLPWAGLMAASVAVLAVAISVLATDHWQNFRAGNNAAPYYTVTSPAPHAPGESVRAVFSPTITLVELQAILDEAQLRIVAGPSEAGVYTLAPTSQRPTRAALALLRAHSNVRFAEGIQTDPRSGEKP